MKTNMNRKTTTGFTLIEVLIGVFIAAVGIVGVLEIQKHVIRSGNEVNARTIAMQLMRDKFDTLKNNNDFNAIAASDAAEAIIKSNYAFKRSWRVTNYYFDDVANDWALVAGGETTEGKQVTVSVKWNDINGETQTVNQNQIISRISIHDASDPTDNSGDKTLPQVPFSELSTIENPSITLVDDVSQYPDYDTKETSKPVPTVDARNGNNLIRFETVTYDTSTDKQTLEDFATVNCSCSFSTSGDAKAPTILTLSDDEESLINDVNSGDLINKVTGVVSGSGQPSLCTKCCADHHDSSESDAKYVAGTSTGNHPHYDIGLSSPVTSGSYVEACRFRRIDGFYEMVPDWQLADIIIMPKSYFFDTANVSDYVSYVKSVVQAKIMGSAMPDKLDIDTRSLTDLVAGEYQLIARGIYVDLASLSSTDLTTIKSYVSGTDYKPNWLEYVPFYEINLSLFGDWYSSSPSIASITNENISTIVDPDTDYYGTYSRGWLTTLVTGETVVTGVARIDNTGITGSGAITPQVTPIEDNEATPDVDESEAGTFMADSINVAVDTDVSGDVDTGSQSIKISVSCVKYRNNGTLTTCSGQDGQSVNLDYSAGLTCSDGVIASFPSYSSPNATCNGISELWTSGWISLSYPGFKFYKRSDDVITAVTELIIYIDMDLVDSDPKQFIEDVVMVKQ